MKLVIAEKPSVAVILNVNMFKGTKRKNIGKLKSHIHNVAVY